MKNKKILINTDVLKVKSTDGRIQRKGILFTKIKSSNLKGYFYNPKTQSLLVLFNNERVYAYQAVSPYKISKLKEAPSVGSYFHSAIRFKHKYLEIK